MTSKPRALDERSHLAIAGVLQGKSRVQAMVQAGYSQHYAERGSTAFFQRPEVVAAIAKGHKEIQAMTLHTVERAMSECLQALEFAKANKNSMAYVKAVELRARLAGLLQDVVRVEHVSVATALADARARTIPCDSYRQIEAPRSLASPPMVDPFAE